MGSSQNGFVSIAPLGGATVSDVGLHKQFCSSTKTTLHRSTTPRKRVCKVVVARVRRGHTSRPKIAEALHKVEPMKDIDRNPFGFEHLKGKVVYAVNVASECEFTEANYKLIQSLLDEHHEDGFEVLAFPCNWFGQKETKSNEEIKAFVHEKYGTKITLMDKSDPEENPVFALGMEKFPGEIYWNFHGKFLFSKDGHAIDRFDLLTLDDHISSRVQAAMFA